MREYSVNFVEGEKQFRLFSTKKNLQRDDITSKMADYVFHAQLKRSLTFHGFDRTMRIFEPLNKRRFSQM